MARSNRTNDGVDPSSAEERMVREAGLGNEAEVRDWLAAGLAPGVVSARKQTALYRAAREGHLAVVNCLVAAGASLELPTPNDPEGNLDLAGNAPSTTKVDTTHGGLRIRFDPGAFLDAQRVRGDLPPWEDITPLMAAVRRGHVEVVRALLAAGADGNARDRSGATPLIVAILTGQRTLAGELIDAGVDVEARDKRGRSPLLVAVSLGARELVETLVGAGATVEDLGPADLVGAAIRGDVDHIRRLLAEGVPVDSPNPSGQVALREAVAHGQMASVSALIEGGADLNAGNSWDRPLSRANYYNRPEVAKVLIRAGATLDREDLESELSTAEGNGRTEMAELLRGMTPSAAPTIVAAIEARDWPLLRKLGTEAHPFRLSQEAHAAAEAGDVDLLREILACGLEPDDAVDESSITALEIAAAHGQAEAVRLLLERGANPKRKNPQDGDTPIRCAARGGSLAAVRLLIDAGAKVTRGVYQDAAEAGNREVFRALAVDLTPTTRKRLEKVLAEALRRKIEQGVVHPRGDDLFLAAFQGKVDELRQLLAAGVPPDAMAGSGSPALVSAALGGKVEVVTVLLAAGAKPDLRDREGHSAAIGAAMVGSEESLKQLAAAGADLNARDYNDKTALDYAIERGHPGTAALLVELGAQFDKDNDPVALAWKTSLTELQSLMQLSRRIDKATGRPGPPTHNVAALTEELASVLKVAPTPVRVLAATLLFEFSPFSERAQDVLKVAEADPDPAVRRAASGDASAADGDEG